MGLNLDLIGKKSEPTAFTYTPDQVILYALGIGANVEQELDLQIDALLARGSRELNPELRAAISRQLEAYVLDLAPMVPLYHTRGLIAMRREVHGLEPGPLGLAVSRLERVWIEPAEDPA